MVNPIVKQSGNEPFIYEIQVLNVLYAIAISWAVSQNKNKNKNKRGIHENSQDLVNHISLRARKSAVVNFHKKKFP